MEEKQKFEWRFQTTIDWESQKKFSFLTKNFAQKGGKMAKVNVFTQQKILQMLPENNFYSIFCYYILEFWLVLLKMLKKRDYC